MSTDILVPVRTKPCSVCGHIEEMQVSAEAYKRWRSGLVIQRAFPMMPKEERELLLTGIHDECWNKIVAEEGAFDERDS